MKNKSLFFFAVLILTFALTASVSAQWKIVNLMEKSDLNSAVQLTTTKSFLVGDSGLFMSSNDGGKTWHKQFLCTYENLNVIKFLDSYCSYIIGDKGVILKSNSRWREWEVVSVGENYFNRDISFFNERNAIIIGYKYRHIYDFSPVSFSSVLVTTDGGNSWVDRSPFNELGRLNSVVCFDNNKAIAVGNYGLVFYTVNGGLTWTKQYLGDNNLNEIKVCRTGDIVIVGDKGTIFSGTYRYRESNPFIWKNLSISSLYNLNSICMNGGRFVIAGERHGVLDGAGNIPPKAVVLESSSLAEGFTEVFNSAEGIFNSINFCNSNKAICVGEKGLAAVYSEINDLTDWVTQKPLQVRNYPNPFNPSTIINYTIPENAFVTIKVYDMLGNEVSTLVESYHNQGTYQYEFNAVNLPAGVYVYTVQAGDYAISEKMLLLK